MSLQSLKDAKLVAFICLSLVSNNPIETKKKCLATNANSQDWMATLFDRCIPSRKSGTYNGD